MANRITYKRSKKRMYILASSLGALGIFGVFITTSWIYGMLTPSGWVLSSILILVWIVSLPLFGFFLGIYLGIPDEADPNAPSGAGPTAGPSATTIPIHNPRP